VRLLIDIKSCLIRLSGQHREKVGIFLIVSSNKKELSFGILMLYVYCKL